MRMVSIPYSDSCSSLLEDGPDLLLGARGVLLVFLGGLDVVERLLELG
jgi:hypothetical protein